MENEMVHLPLRVKPAMKEQIALLADQEGMRKSEYVRFLLRTALDSRQARLGIHSNTVESHK